MGCVRARTAGSACGNRSHWCRSWCWMPRTFLCLVHTFSEFDDDNGLVKIRLSHQISCKHHSRSKLVSFKCYKCRHNTSHLLYLHHTINIFPSIGLSYWKLNFLTLKTSWTSRRKASGCGKLPHDTRWVLSPHAGPHVRTRQCEHYLSIHVWTFGADPQCGTRSAGPHARKCQCECTFKQDRMKFQGNGISHQGFLSIHETYGRVVGIILH